MCYLPRQTKWRATGVPRITSARGSLGRPLHFPANLAQKSDLFRHPRELIDVGVQSRRQREKARTLPVLTVSTNRLWVRKCYVLRVSRLLLLSNLEITPVELSTARNLAAHCPDLFVRFRFRFRFLLKPLWPHSMRSGADRQSGSGCRKLNGLAVEAHSRHGNWAA